MAAVEPVSEPAERVSVCLLAGAVHSTAWKYSPSVMGTKVDFAEGVLEVGGVDSMLLVLPGSLGVISGVVAHGLCLSLPAEVIDTSRLPAELCFDLLMLAFWGDVLEAFGVAQSVASAGSSVLTGVMAPEWEPSGLVRGVVSQLFCLSGMPSSASFIASSFCSLAELYMGLVKATCELPQYKLKGIFNI